MVSVPPLTGVTVPIALPSIKTLAGTESTRGDPVGITVNPQLTCEFRVIVGFELKDAPPAIEVAIFADGVGEVVGVGVGVGLGVTLGVALGVGVGILVDVPVTIGGVVKVVLLDAAERLISLSRARSTLSISSSSGIV
jgi:hypothetical protein